MQQKSSLVTRLGCGCLWAYVLMVGLVFAHMLVVWPLASSLGPGAMGSLHQRQAG